MRIIVGMSGATGAIYGIRTLQALRKLGVETFLILTHYAEGNITLETGWDIADVKKLATEVYDDGNLAAAISSGSFHTDGMVVIPCSVKSLSAMASSLNSTLLIRAADVTLKERRKLVVVFRETPLHLGHLKRMTELTEMGATILPPMPAFYHKPRTVDDIVNQTVGKVLDQFGVDGKLFSRWTGVLSIKTNTR